MSDRVKVVFFPGGGVPSLSGMRLAARNFEKNGCEVDMDYVGDIHPFSKGSTSIINDFWKIFYYAGNDDIVWCISNGVGSLRAATALLRDFAESELALNFVLSKRICGSTLSSVYPLISWAHGSSNCYYGPNAIDRYSTNALLKIMSKDKIECTFPNGVHINGQQDWSRFSVAKVIPLHISSIIRCPIIADLVVNKIKNINYGGKLLVLFEDSYTDSENDLRVFHQDLTGLMHFVSRLDSMGKDISYGVSTVGDKTSLYGINGETILRDTLSEYAVKSDWFYGINYGVGKFSEFLPAIKYGSEWVINYSIKFGLSVKEI